MLRGKPIRSVIQNVVPVTATWLTMVKPSLTTVTFEPAGKGSLNMICELIRNPALATISGIGLGPKVAVRLASVPLIVVCDCTRAIASSSAGLSSKAADSRITRSETKTSDEMIDSSVRVVSIVSTRSPWKVIMYVSTCPS